jgi:hypothetical protein
VGLSSLNSNEIGFKDRFVLTFFAHRHQYNINYNHEAEADLLGIPLHTFLVAYPMFSSEQTAFTNVHFRFRTRNDKV